MNKNTFFITTPIYYTNGIPHIWHAYSSILADTIARFQKISWKDVKFSTWVDENSQKAVIKAQELWMDIMPYLDMMAEKHKNVWDSLKINYTDFIRTTEERHHKLVRKVLQKCFDNWDIYQAEYEWMYCIWCESFKKDDDLIERDWKKVCPDHLTEPQKLKEKNWFFKLSKYENKLKDLYNHNPNFVLPDYRFNEVKAFVDRWLEDFSISRETNKFGIKLPFDESQVTYVWFDALFNYVTVCESPNNNESHSHFWPADLHVVWKDIIRFHAIYWPAMLMSSWYDIPKNILTTGYFTVDWQKISKSIWNAIDPIEFSKKYSIDLLKLYMLSTINIWQDWDFSEKQAILMYNAKLANNLWNLLNRVVVLSLKLNNNPWILNINNSDIYFLDEILNWYKNYNIKSVLDNTFKYLDSLNKFADETSPWITIKDLWKQEEVRLILSKIASWLRLVWFALYPIFTEKISEMFKKMWFNNYSVELNNWKLFELLNDLNNTNITEKWDGLFLRIDL